MKTDPDLDAAIKFTGYDDCILGICEPWQPDGDRPTRLIYSGEKIIESLVSQGLSQDDAIEYLYFNIDGAYLGANTPIIAWQISEEDL